MALSSPLAHRLILLTALFAVACAEVAPTNPFDPGTPAAQQAKAIVRGFVELPDDYPPERFGGAGIELVGLGDVSGSGQQAALSPVPVVVAGDPVRAPFTFEGVPAGRYTLRARVEGFIVRRVPFDFDVAIAEDLDLGKFEATLSATSAIEGIAMFEPAPPYGHAGHAGIFVEVSNSPVITQTNSEGEYRLTLGAGTYTVTFTAPGHDPVQLADQRVDEGQVLLVPAVALHAKPATVEGRVLRTGADGSLAPAEGASVTLTEAGTLVDQTNTDAEGGFTITGFRGGAHLVTATLAGHAASTREVVTANGQSSPLGDLVVSLDRGTISGAVSREGALGLGGATIRVSRRAAPPFADEVLVRTTVTAAPDDAFALTGLPTGTYDLLALAEGFRLVSREGLLVVKDETSSVNDTLGARTFSLSGPAQTNVSPVTVTLAADLDMTFARTWIDQPEPPDGLVFSPLPALGLIAVALPTEGLHVVYAQLATAAYVNPSPATAHLSAASPVLSAVIALDTQPPSVTVRHVPAGGAQAGFVRFGEDANFELSGDDRFPGTGLSTVQITRDNQAPIAQPFSPRLGLAALAAGERTVRFVPVDLAGNQGEAATLDLLIDATAPEGALSASQPTTTRETAVVVSVTASDPDGAPMEYRLFEAGQAGGAFRPFPLGQRPGASVEAVEVVLLREVDGPQARSGEVRDAAGRVTTLNEITFILDREAHAPTALVVTRPAGAAIAQGARVRLIPLVNGSYAVDLQVAVAGATEPLVVHLVGGPASCSIDNPAQLATCAMISVPVDAAAGGVQLVRLSVYTTDEAGNQSSEISTSFTVDLDPPRGLGLAVIRGLLGVENGSLGVTNGVALDVELSASGAVSYEISGDVAAVPQTPAAFPVQQRLVLTAMDGVKDLNVTFRDEAGNEAQLATTLTLDRTAPTFTATLMREGVALDPVSPRVSGLDLTVHIVTQEVGCSGAGSCTLEKRVSLSSDFSDAAFSPFTADTPLVLPAIDGDHDVYVEVRDLAGNIATHALGVALQVELDQSGPQAPGLRRTYIAAEKIRLELTPPGDLDVAYYVVERNLPGQDGDWSRVALHPAVADDTSTNGAIACPVQRPGCGGEGDEGASLCLRPARGVMLLEDRGVQTGFEHRYRAQAVDSLGNESGFSAVVDGGVPIHPPSFRIDDVHVIEFIGDNILRTVVYATGLGTFFLDFARIYQRELDGSLRLEDPPIDPAVGAMQVVVPQLTSVLGSVRLHGEAFVLQVANADRSMVWQSEVLSPEVSRRDLFEGASSSGPVGAVVDASGDVHVLRADGLGRLLYASIERDGSVSERRDLLQRPNPLPEITTTAVLHVIQGPGGDLLALTLDENSGWLRLVDFTDPDAPEVRDLADLCPAVCPVGRFAAQVAVSSVGGTTHVAYQSPVTRTLYYDSFGAEAPVFLQIDAVSGAGQDLRLFLTGNTPSIIMVAPSPQPSANKDLVYLTLGANWQRSDIKEDIFSTFSPRMMDAKLVGNTYQLTWAGSIRGVANSDYLHSATFNPAVGMSLVTTLRNLASLSPPRDSNGLRAPAVLPVGLERLYLAVGRLPGTDTVYFFQDPERNQSYVDARLGSVATGVAEPGPDMEAVLDADGRARAYIGTAGGGITEFIAAPRGPGRRELGTASTLAAPDGRVAMLDSISAVAPLGHGNSTPAAGQSTTLIGRQANRLYGVVDSGVPFVVENTAARSVTRGTSLASNGVSTFALYLVSPGNPDTPPEVYLRRVVPPPGVAPVAERLDGSTAFRSSHSDGSNQVRLVYSADLALNSAWVRTAADGAVELVYWKRTSANVTSTAVFRGVAFGGRPPIPALARPRVLAQRGMRSESIFTVATPEGIQILFSSGTEIVSVLPDAPPREVYRTMDGQSSDLALLDAVSGPDGRLYVAFTRGDRLFLSRFLETPVEVTDGFDRELDAARLVPTFVGETGLAFTARQVNVVSATWSMELKYLTSKEAPVAITASTPFLLANSQHVASLAVVEDGRHGSDILEASRDVLNLGEQGLATATRVRPYANSVITHTRVDGLRSLGIPGDRDEDGVADLSDFCPDVFDSANTVAACDVACAPACDVADNLNLQVVPPGRAYVLVGTTVGAGADSAGACLVNSAAARDVMYAFTAPVAAAYTFEVTASTFDTVLYVLDGCDASVARSLGCNDDFNGTRSSLVLNLAVNQLVYVVVDGYSSVAAGDFTLSVHP